jgi:AraC-like DNA-binding protein
MKKEIIHIKSIREYNQLLGINGLKNPLMSILAYQNLPPIPIGDTVKLTFGFYIISIKIDYDCKIRYGQTGYDFDEGVMGFIAPNQLHTIDSDFKAPQNGWSLMIHPDFFSGFPIATKIRQYGFFEYHTNEALILSEDEEKSIIDLFQSIQSEYNRPIDSFSQDVLIAQIEYLLALCNRFYTRQFITRKKPNSDLLSKFDSLIFQYFNNKLIDKEPPTVKSFAQKINVSPNYLSDMLRSISGKNAQQHIHDKLIEKAKELLSSTNLSVSEISYQLGFEYSQSFSKLFKSKTNISPLAFRQSYN